MSNQNNRTSPYWTVHEFMSCHHICRATVYNWINSKLIKAVKIGNRTLIPKDQEFVIPIQV